MAKIYSRVLAFFFCLMTLSCGPGQISEVKSNEQLKRSMIIKTSNGKIYKVGSDFQTLTAFQGDDSLWTTDIGNAFDSTIPGKNEIRSIKTDPNGIMVLFGKHCYVLVDTIKGSITTLECD
jgi:hypothetical protein